VRAPSRRRLRHERGETSAGHYDGRGACSAAGCVLVGRPDACRRASSGRQPVGPRERQLLASRVAHRPRALGRRSRRPRGAPDSPRRGALLAPRSQVRRRLHPFPLRREHRAGRGLRLQPRRARPRLRGRPVEPDAGGDRGAGAPRDPAGGRLRPQLSHAARLRRALAGGAARAGAPLGRPGHYRRPARPGPAGRLVGRRDGDGLPLPALPRHLSGPAPPALRPRRARGRGRRLFSPGERLPGRRHDRRRPAPRPPPALARARRDPPAAAPRLPLGVGVFRLSARQLDDREAHRLQPPSAVRAGNVP